MTTDANRRTVAAYERYARDYAQAVSPQPSDAHALALRRFAAALPPPARVLDIGSGPGWDADYLETLGASVHRTDVTEAFRAVQAERGKQVDAFDLLTDTIDGTYGGITLLCVIQHFERAQIAGVLRKLHGALSTAACCCCRIRSATTKPGTTGSRATTASCAGPAMRSIRS